MTRHSEELVVPCHTRTNLGLSSAREPADTAARASLISCHPRSSQKDTVQEPRMPWLETSWSGQWEPASRLGLQYPSLGTSHCLALNSPEAPEERMCGPNACGLRAVESWLKGWPWSRKPQKLRKYLFSRKLVFFFQNSV